jgi:hypothetical protein
MTDAAVMRVGKAEMLRLLHAVPDFAEAFTVHLLTRNSRVEADLADRTQSSHGCLSSTAPTAFLNS